MKLVHPKHELQPIPSLSTQAELDRLPENLYQVKVSGVLYTKDEVLDRAQKLAEKYPGRKITRDFFRAHAEMPEKVWTTFFGSFPEFLREAGLNFTRGQNKIVNRIAQHASVDELRKLSEDRKEYARLHPKADGNGRWKTMVAGSDWHDTELDPFYHRVFVETVRVVQPDVVCLDGDIFDCPEFGKYTVDPREWDVVGRIKFGLAAIEAVRKAAPNAQIDLIEGNHEARLIRHLAECSPAMRAILSDVHDMNIRKLLKLDELEVNYVAMGDLFAFTDSQVKRETEKNYKVYWDSILAHHYPHGRRMGVPGFNGHHHKHVVWSEHNASFGSYTWHQMGAGHIRQAPYCDGSKWNNGFLIAHVDSSKRYTNFEYVDVGATMAVSAGNFFYRSKDEIYPALQTEFELRNRD